MVKGDYEDWDYSRWGRTDKGVSAAGNVFSIKIRNFNKRQKTEEEEDQISISDVQPSTPAPVRYSKRFNLFIL